MHVNPKHEREGMGGRGEGQPQPLGAASIHQESPTPRPMARLFVVVNPAASRTHWGTQLSSLPLPASGSFAHILCGSVISFNFLTP